MEAFEQDAFNGLSPDISTLLSLLPICWPLINSAPHSLRARWAEAVGPFPHPCHDTLVILGKSNCNSKVESWARVCVLTLGLNRCMPCHLFIPGKLSWFLDFPHELLMSQNFQVGSPNFCWPIVTKVIHVERFPGSSIIGKPVKELWYVWLVPVLRSSLYEPVCLAKALGLDVGKHGH